MSPESTMASPTKASKHLQPLNTNWHNRSLSNVSATSDAATFHSAHDHPSSSQMELRPLSSSQPTTTPLPISPTKPLSPKLSAVKMSRQDSGYSEQPSSSTSTPRTSTSSARHSSPSKSKRRSTTDSKSSTRPSAKRASRSSPSTNTAQVRTSASGSRPSLSSRHTNSYPQTQSVHHQQPYKFFQFPTLVDPLPPTPSTSAEVAPPPPPPPATIQYWTSDSTRRLEYAAIDAASRGFRGFFIKLVPDCILPAEKRRTRFACEDAGSDAGSVRRYRIALPEEKDCASASTSENLCGGGGKGEGEGRPRGLLRRWTGLGRR